MVTTVLEFSNKLKWPGSFDPQSADVYKMGRNIFILKCIKIILLFHLTLAICKNKTQFFPMFIGCVSNTSIHICAIFLV